MNFNDISWIKYVSDEVWNNLPSSTLKTRTRSEYNFRCPICGDSKKNKYKKRGYFYTKTGTFYCFNCGTSMSGYAFLKAICPMDIFDRIIHEYKILNFNHIIKGGSSSLSANNNNQQSSYLDILSPNPSYKNLLADGWKTYPLSKDAISYLDSRKIPSSKRDMLCSIMDKNNNEFILIKYIYDDIVIYHQLANFKNHQIVGRGAIKYIFPSDDTINNQQKPIFNLDNIDISFPYIYCTEGVFDSLFLKNGVALGGKILSKYQYDMLHSCYPRHKIVLAFDNDISGIKSTLSHCRKYNDIMFLDNYDLLNAVKVKDINDFIKKTNRTDVFMDGKILEKMTCSSFKIMMKLKLASC